MMATAVGKFLRKLRVDSGETLSAMALKIGVSAAYLSSAEVGNRRFQTWWLESIADVYGLGGEARRGLLEAAKSDVLAPFAKLSKEWEEG